MNEQPNEAASGFNIEDIEWVWVLTSSQSLEQDNIFAVEMDDKESGTHRRIVPIFQNRENAEGLKLRLGAGNNHLAHSIALKEVGQFAVDHDLEIMLLDQAGVIIAHLEVRLEQAPSLH